jgi:hypothetical protein
MRTFHMVISAFFVLASVAWLAPGTGAAQPSPTSWGLTVSVNLCDENPIVVGEAANCEPAAGIVVDVSYSDGSYIGSCTTELTDTPYGTQMSYCAVEGVPLNATLVITQDSSTIPDGYSPINDAQTLVVGDLIPGGGDQSTITFINIKTDGNDGLLPPGSDEKEVEVDGVTPPSTGDEFPAFVQRRTCDNPGEISLALEHVTAETGLSVGLDSAIRPQISNSTVAMSLDVLIDEPHSIVVYESTAENAPVMLCGNIGGLDNDDGVLYIGLADQGDSGFTGLASLAYSERAGETDIAIFIVPA